MKATPARMLSTVSQRMKSSSNQLFLAPSSSTNCMARRLMDMAIRPSQSTPLASEGSPLSKFPQRPTRKRTSRPGGTLMKNSQRHESASVRWPPRVGPTVGAMVTIMPTMTVAVMRRSGGKAVKAVAKTGGIMAPAASPCRARAKIIMSIEVQRPAQTLVAMKAAQATMNIGRVPHSRVI